MLLWLYGGGQIGFYRNYYSITKIDPILGIDYEEQVSAFLPGIETLVGGFALFAFLLLVAALIERRTDSVSKTLSNNK